MSKKIVVSFPGGRGYEVPLLYFGSKYFENVGYEKLFINHPASGDISNEAIYENVKRVFSEINFAEYEHVVFIGKSLGTYVACKLKEEYCIPATLILLTPIEPTLVYIRESNDIRLVATAENDRHVDAGLVRALCDKERIPCYVEPNVGHRMEVKGDIRRDLQIVANVLEEIDKKVIR